MKNFVRKTINRFGYDIVRYADPRKRNLNLDENLGFDMEAEATEAIRIVKDNTMLSKRRLVTLYQQVAYCERSGLSGAFVECGVWKGGAVGLMALANLKHGAVRRHIHLFDAFQDICEPDEAKDGERAVREVRLFTGSRSPKGCLQPLEGFYDQWGGYGSLEENQKLLEERIDYERDRLHYHVGWFQDTVPVVHDSIGDIALLRLDGDWYASTKVCLDHLYDHVVPGGIIILDDYGTYEGCRKAVHEFLDGRGLLPYLCHVDSDCRFFFKPA